MIATGQLVSIYIFLIIERRSIEMERKKYVYLFSEGDVSQKNLLGGKGANLSEMTRLGIPVPQGFTVTTEA